MESQGSSSEVDYLQRAAEEAAAQLASSSALPTTAAKTNGGGGGGGGGVVSSHNGMAETESHVYVAYPRPLGSSSTAAATAASAHPMYGSPLLPASVGRHNGFLRTYKVLIVGEAGVGKSNLMHRYCHNAYDPALPSTLGAEFCSREVDIPCGVVGMTETVVLQLWDTAGQERNAGVISNAFYRNAVGAILVYDATRRETLVNLPRWAARVTELACEDCVCVVVGAKVDLLTGEARHTSALDALQQEADNISHAMGMRNFMTSALSGVGVLEAFTHLVLAVDAVQAAALEPTAASASPSSGAHSHPSHASPAHTRGGFASRGAQMWTAVCSVPATPMGVMGGMVGGAHPGGWSSATSTPSASTAIAPTALLQQQQQQQLMHASSSSAVHDGGAYTGSASSLENLAQQHASRTPASAAAGGAALGKKKKPLDLRGFGSAEAGPEGGSSVPPDISVSGRC